jgi:hypothetical protein
VLERDWRDSAICPWLFGEAFDYTATKADGVRAKQESRLLVVCLTLSDCDSERRILQS